ncbi:hypothetical protein [Powai lake megavirus]|uniref:Uncharacterized protein n=1 Tax=Powai lake megavirus TaxID=1842663 RepID=A0A160EPX0_9VIRU|nr:hypothetical protein QJ849_gp900 [Powai lake megavirus]ANB51062.1 hypothetical protein [Powai lake megavirus]
MKKLNKKYYHTKFTSSVKVMDTNNLIISFPNTNKRYEIPISKINKFPDSFLAAYIRFEKNYQYQVEICSYEEFKHVYEFIVNDKLDIYDYFNEYNIFDYFGLNSGIINKYIKLANSKLGKINRFVHNNDSKYYIVNNLDEYIEYKKLFSKESHIIPFQYINLSVNLCDSYNNTYFLDALFIGNGECCDIGSINTKPHKQKSYMNFKKQNKEMPKGLPFDWLSNINLDQIKFFYENCDEIIDNDDYSRHCFSNMNKTYTNEIEYLISGIKIIYRDSNWNFDNSNSIDDSDWIPTNDAVLDKYVEKYQNHIINYEYVLPSIKLNDFEIRHKICNGEYFPTINQNIIYSINSDGNEYHYPITCRLTINAYFGFINTKN